MELNSCMQFSNEPKNIFDVIKNDFERLSRTESLGLEIWYSLQSFTKQGMQYLQPQMSVI